MGHELSSLTEKQLSYLRRGNIGFVFQDFFLISSLTALENVKAALVFARIKDKDERAVQILERLGLGNRVHHYPEELSGGELQRVAIARALVISPKIILADEPTGNLDTKNALLIYEIFQQINREEKITIIAATHNVKLGYLANRVIHLVDGYIEKDERLR
jgi:putative ABC transport system ATP-binding protein